MGVGGQCWTTCQRCSLQGRSAVTDHAAETRWNSALSRQQGAAFLLFLEFFSSLFVALHDVPAPNPTPTPIPLELRAPGTQMAPVIYHRGSDSNSGRCHDAFTAAGGSNCCGSLLQEKVERLALKLSVPVQFSCVSLCCCFP